MYTDISLDLETLDIRPSAVVLSIGAVRFNRHERDSFDGIKEDEDRCFYAKLPIQAQIDLGRTISASTINWWMEQNVMAKRVFAESENPKAFREFQKFCRGAQQIWGNGSNFDNVILRSLFEDLNIEFPTPYYTDRDLRTLQDAAQIGKPRAPKGIEHNALDDAIYQAISAQEYWYQIHGPQTRVA